MHWLPATRRGGGTHCRSALAAGLLGGVIAWAAWPAVGLSQVPVLAPRAAGDDATGAAETGVYLPTDRSLSRTMSRARERLDSGEYHQAISFLQQVLARDEDSFLDDQRGGGKPGGLKAAARRWIGELPPAGREAYELLQGPAARRELDAALKAGDSQGVARVVRQYFHTSAGYEAALVLAQIEADHGHHLAAAQLYQELIESPQAAAQFEPQVSVLAALNHLAAGQTDRAAETLRALVQKHRAATLVLAGRTTSLPAADRDPVAWLSQMAGQPLQLSPREQDWLTLGGDASRHLRAFGGAPHLRVRWTARVVNEPSLESFLTTRGEHYQQRGTTTIPAARPIAVNDVVLMRTPHNVVAVDWRTGKRIWETREEDFLAKDDPLSEGRAGYERGDWTGAAHPLEQRVWDDALAMSLSSDGERVFVIRGLSTGAEDEAQAWRVAPFGGAVGVTTLATNRLAAYELATEGKLVWEIDGDKPAGPLAGAFFLGAPLAIDNTLFVLAEIRSAVYLVALEPRTGQLKWQQQLVGMEQSIGLEPRRRFAGAVPSYAGGVLVCPTAAGATIGIDVVRREFAWVYRYPRKVPSAAEIRNMWHRQMQSQSSRLNDYWLDSSARIADAHVLLTPPESSELHCLDLRSGELRWKHPQGDALFIGCVDGGIVLLVGSKSLSAVHLANGTPAWGDQPVALPAGALAAGHGYLSEGHYYLPLTSGELLTIDVSSGTIVSSTATESGQPLGNLISYRGSVLSQSALVLDKFEQLDVLRRRTEQALAANPDDAVAIRELAEMKRIEGDLAEAIVLLKRARQLAPDDVAVREILAEALIEGLRSDFTAYRDDLPSLRRLVRGHEQEIELRRIEARGLEELGERLEALDAYLELVDLTADLLPDVKIDANHIVRSDRWLSGRLAALWSEATAEDRTAIMRRIEDRQPTQGSASEFGEARASELRHYLAHFDQLPGADEVRLRLVRWLVERQSTQEAELELLQLGTSEDEQWQAASAALMTELLARAGQERDAVRYAQVLAGRWYDAPTVDGLTAVEWLERLGRRGILPETLGEWPQGQVKASVRTVQAPARDRRARTPQFERHGLRRLRLEQDFGPAPSGTQWFVAGDMTQLVGRDPLGDDVHRLGIEQGSLARQYRDSSFVQAARLGHLLFVSLGGQILAIDTRHGELEAGAEVLWRGYPLGRFPVSSSRARSQRRMEIYHPNWSGRKRVSGALGPVVGALGPATPRGVVVQEQDQLKCLDPLSGEMVWSRTGVPIGCELFGDEEVVVAADIENREAQVFSMVDGRLLVTRELPDTPWMLTAGRNVAQHSVSVAEGRRDLVLRVTDMWTGETRFEAQYDGQARLGTVEPRFVAAYDPSGRLQLIDAVDGRVVIDENVEAVSSTEPLQTLLAGDELFIMITSQPVQQLHRPIGPDFPLVNGLVYAFSMTTGKALWPGPAVVRHRGVALGQPDDIPLLVFVDRRMKQDAGGGGAQLRLLCIDKATGRTVYRNDGLPDTAGSRLSIRADQDVSPSVTIELGAREVELAMSDRPRPPAPPANDDIETQRESEERGLWGVGRRIGEVLQEALQTPQGTNRRGGASNPLEEPVPAQPDGDEE